MSFFLLYDAVGQSMTRAGRDIFWLQRRGESVIIIRYLYAGLVYRYYIGFPSR